jgi:hypothetical protein
VLRSRSLRRGRRVHDRPCRAARAVDHVFAVKWSDALKNGAILGMVDFGEMDHVRNADQKFWPSIGMSVAETRNLFFGGMIPRNELLQAPVHAGVPAVSQSARPRKN